jgi:uncharacterized protein YaaN involved in tellurite resistance
MGVSHSPPSLYSNSSSSISNGSLAANQLHHVSSSLKQNKLPGKISKKEQANDSPQPPKSSFTSLFHKSTSSIAAIFANLMCTR